MQTDEDWQSVAKLRIRCLKRWERLTLAGLMLFFNGIKGDLKKESWSLDF